MPKMWRTVILSKMFNVWQCLNLISNSVTSNLANSYYWLVSHCCNHAYRQPWHITVSINYPSETSAATKKRHTVPDHTQDQRRHTAHRTACYYSQPGEQSNNKSHLREDTWIWANNQCSQEDCSYHQSRWRMCLIQSRFARARQPQQMQREMAVADFMALYKCCYYHRMEAQTGQAYCKLCIPIQRYCCLHTVSQV